MRGALLVLVVACALGCGDDNLSGVGQPCTTSGDCAEGLLCDFGHHPPVCATTGTISRDMAVPRARDGSADMRIDD